MTRPFHQKTLCSACGAIATAETGFGRWIRMQPELHSVQIGLVVNDIDYPIHRYKTDTFGRDVQLYMECEVKTFGAEPSPSQMDTLHLRDQLLNNRKSTPTKKKDKRQGSGAIRKAYSYLLKRYVTVWSFGAYLLQFQHTNPDDSDWIKWGPMRREITRDQLVGLLRFDLDPDTMRHLDIRSHHTPPLRSATPDLFSPHGLPVASPSHVSPS